MLGRKHSLRASAILALIVALGLALSSTACTNPGPTEESHSSTPCSYAPGSSCSY
jgi:hypothetical protein